MDSTRLELWMGYLMFWIFSALSGFSQAQVNLADRLKAQGFECRALSSGQSECYMKAVNTSGFRYSEPVMILIPKDLVFPEKIIFHLHGHVQNHLSLAETAKNFQLADLHQRAGLKDSIMIIPGSRGKCETYNQELVPKFREFKVWLEQLIEAKNKRWVMTGHSGAYSSIGRILKNETAQLGGKSDFIKNLDGVVLLDATYGRDRFDTSPYREYLRFHPAGRVKSVYRRNPPLENGTVVGSQKLQKDLGLSDQDIFASETSSDPRAKDHNEMFKLYFPKLVHEVMNRDEDQNPIGSSAGTR